MHYFGLHILDLLIIGVSLLAVVVLGVWVSRDVHGETEFFVGKRSLGRSLQFFMNFGTMSDPNAASMVASSVFAQGTGGIWIGGLLGHRSGGADPALADTERRGMTARPRDPKKAITTMTITLLPSDTRSVPVQSPVSFPWVPDQGDGTFCNPVIHADYSDPDVVRHGTDFYMVASSFNCTPGLPILHSCDLVNWTLINHAVQNLPHPRYAQVQSGSGVWAPALRFHDGKFWIFFSLPDEGLYMITAADPAGQWSEPHLLAAGVGLIDPCPHWDEDGQAYLVHAYAHSRAGIKDVLRVCPMAPDGSRLLGQGQIVVDDPKRHPTIEGPKFLKKDGWYYLLAPAGGVDTGWQTALRSRSIYGPYESRIVLAQGQTPVNGPHQGALIDLPSGEWWFVHFQDAGVYGRIMHLQPVQWKNGWPLIGEMPRGGGVGEPVLHTRKPDVGGTYPPAVPATTDTFSGGMLGRQWQWNANHAEHWHSLSARPGFLRLFSQSVHTSDLAAFPALLLQKFPARTFAVQTTLEFFPAQKEEEAGLIVTGSTYAALAVRYTGSGRQIVLYINGHEEEVISLTSLVPVTLRVDVQDGGLCHFLYALPGSFVPIGPPFQATKGHWIGARVGLFSRAFHPQPAAGHADFGAFRFSSPMEGK